MSTDPNIDRRAAAVAAGAAVIFLGAAGLFWLTDSDGDAAEANGDDASPTAELASSPAPEPDGDGEGGHDEGEGDDADGRHVDGTGDESEGNGPGTAADGDAGQRMVEAAEKLPLPEDCHLHVARAVIASDPATAAGFAKIGLTTATIRPAQPAGQGAHALMVRNTTRVDCDLTQGVIGTRGGIRFTVGDRKVELRRGRVDLSSGSMAVYPRSTGTESFIGSEISSDTIRRIEQPGEVTVVIPMMFTEALAQHFNGELGIPLSSAGDVIGSLTITATSHDDPLKDPDAHD